MTQLSTKIIRILSSSQVLVNVGETPNFFVGALGKILGPDEEIIDPETEEKLGIVKISKGLLRIEAIYDRFSLCKITRINSTRKPYLINQADAPVKISDISPWKSTTEPIKVGDVVIFDLHDEERNDVNPSEDEIPF